MEEQFQDLFRIKHNRKEVNVGNILIAEPFLEGKYFSRSVVYIVEHDDKGSIGFVLNKPIAFTTSHLVDELEGVSFPVYNGGPVERNRLYYIHRNAELEDALHIADGVYWGGDFSTLCKMLKEGKIRQNDIRFFAGYSGWDGGQLKKELEENSWLVGDITQERVFEQSDKDFWEISMRELG